jgi:hypothetical protein
MKLKNLFFIMIISAGATLSSCYYDKADLLYGSTAPCDSLTTASYSLNIVPLLQQHCYSCHAGSGASGGIVMGTYASDRAIALNGKLYGSISYSSGFSPMPQAASKLAACQLAVIKLWIDQNSPNN